MGKHYEGPPLRRDLIQRLRGMVFRGDTVPELAAEINGALSLPGTAAIPVLLYFAEAFDLSLKDVLPIREWIGTHNDEEINAAIMPLIWARKTVWCDDHGKN
jgi:hypothetical protein